MVSDYLRPINPLDGVLVAGMAPDLLCSGQVFYAKIMTLDQAIKQVQTCAAQMNARYHQVVFDEWAIIYLNDRKGFLHAYEGPRKKEFQKNFLADAGSLRAGLLTRQQGPGEFEFARQETGTGFESFMALGEGTFLICNNTVQSMDNISRNPLWLSAQVPFVELSDKFRSDPLRVAA